MSKKKHVTNREIFQAIYDCYYDDYCQKNLREYGEPGFDDYGWIELNVDMLAKKMNIPLFLLYGRLKGYEKAKKGNTFTFQPDGPPQDYQYDIEAINGVNFPRLSAVIADLDEQNRRHSKPFWMSLAACFSCFYFCYVYWLFFEIITQYKPARSV